MPPLLFRLSLSFFIVIVNPYGGIQKAEDDIERNVHLRKAASAQAVPVLRNRKSTDDMDIEKTWHLPGRFIVSDSSVPAFRQFRSLLFLDVVPVLTVALRR